ncbi:helix-turn-helix transcriptional regulator [Acetivibrio cellulolyticus]|uniref:helix-turn-helix transcriptional regulator n=1 Tax=Acetivibrio cellulolyticus TaxID=35830 RepID=UPI0001E2C792|nr:helix-turn-helix domain-containing protein [Acetivibrio cellulolyticus]
MRNRMFEARLKLKLTHQEVAKQSKISRSFYTLIENGLKNPSIEVALRVAKVLNLSVEDLFE